MSKIKLNFINKSNDANNSSVVIFQKNVGGPASDEVVAWTVIENCGPLENHPFTFSDTFQISSGDASGNYLPQTEARPSDLFARVSTSSGDALQVFGAANSPDEIQVRNDLNAETISTNIYRDGKLLAIKTGIAPGQNAVFQFPPSIFIGVASQILEGDVMDPAILTTVNSELSLLGIAYADIIMTGGGPGETSTPFEFHLENIKLA
jgi:hypothetical protein